MVKLLHTSDLQLDAPFRFLGERGSQHRRQLCETLRRIVDLAAVGYDALLIAGDLFDTPRPQGATVDFVCEQLGRLSIPVCILPGNHDGAGEGTVYQHTRFPANVLLFSEEHTCHLLPELDLALYGRPLPSAASRQSPLRGLAPDAPARWHVALAHGNLVRPDIPDPPRPVRSEEIAGCGMHYVALGDWHAYADCSQGPVVACYSGAPEPTATTQSGAGYVVRIELEGAGARTHPLRVGRITARELSVDVTGKTPAQVAEEIRTHADAHCMLRVALTGLAPLGTLLDPAQLEEELSPAFYYLACELLCHPELDSVGALDGEFDGGSAVLARFVQMMRERIASADDDASRRRAEEALQLGVALLQGRRVL